MDMHTTHARTHARTRAHTHARKHTHTHAHIHARTNALAGAHTHTHSKAIACSSQLSLRKLMSKLECTVTLQASLSDIFLLGGRMS